MQLNEQFVIKIILFILTGMISAFGWITKAYINKIDKKIDTNTNDINVNKEDIIKLNGKNEVYDEIMRTFKEDAAKTEKSIADINNSLTEIKVLIASKSNI